MRFMLFLCVFYTDRLNTNGTILVARLSAVRIKMRQGQAIDGVVMHRKEDLAARSWVWCKPARPANRDEIAPKRVGCAGYRVPSVIGMNFDIGFVWIESAEYRTLAGPRLGMPATDRTASGQ